MAADGHVATVGAEYGGEYPEGSRLARAVGPQESEYLPLAYGKRNSVDRQEGIEALVKIGGDKEVVIHCPTSTIEDTLKYDRFSPVDYVNSYAEAKSEP